MGRKELRYRCTIGMLVGIIFGILVGVALFCNVSNAKAKLGKTQEKRIKQAMEFMTKPSTWDKYGVWPSTYLMQTFIESCMWKKPRHGMNGHGEMSSRYYPTVKSAAKGYCQLINKHWYKGAPFMKCSYSQLDKILDCGYCQPRGSYWGNAVSSCEKYGWKKYDKILKKKLRKREKKKKIELARKKEFNVVFRADLLPWQIRGDKDIVPEHSTIQIGYKLLEVIDDEKGLGNTIQTGDRFFALAIHRTKIDCILENCKG